MRFSVISHSRLVTSVTFFGDVKLRYVNVAVETKAKSSAWTGSNMYTYIYTSKVYRIGGGERCAQGSGGETGGKKTIRETQA